ncbi:MAG: DUF3267 domain-containing protein [Ruminococcus sp.]|nr:DUF3267 domain-containing protein [Ruminococcus sp.]
MKIVFKGQYNGDPESLPAEKIEENSYKITEVKDTMSKLSIISVVLFFVLLLFFRLRAGDFNVDNRGIIVWLLTILPHEFLHALAFKETVYLYYQMPFGVFVYCQEKIAKPKFIFMCLLPNIIFGFIPFIIFIFFPNQNLLGTLGMVAITGGIGDFYNIYNVIRQTPKNATIYMNKTETYWYL